MASKAKLWMNLDLPLACRPQYLAAYRGHLNFEEDCSDGQKKEGERLMSSDHLSAWDRLMPFLSDPTNRLTSTEQRTHLKGEGERVFWRRASIDEAPFDSTACLPAFRSLKRPVPSFYYWIGYRFFPRWPLWLSACYHQNPTFSGMPKLPPRVRPFSPIGIFSSVITFIVRFVLLYYRITQMCHFGTYV